MTDGEKMIVIMIEMEKEIIETETVTTIRETDDHETARDKKKTREIKEIGLTDDMMKL